MSGGTKTEATPAIAAATRLGCQRVKLRLSGGDGGVGRHQRHADDDFGGRSILHREARRTRSLAESLCVAGLLEEVGELDRAGAGEIVATG